MKAKSLIVLSFIYLFLRSINLTLLPIFNDESIYLDWGYRTVNLKGQLFYPLFDAKPPLLMWFFGLSQKIFSDPLFAGRVVSVACGYLTMLGIYFLAERHFGKKTAVFSSLLYIVVPIFSFFDRQALMESAMGAIGVWSLLLFLKLHLKNRITDAVYLGLVLAAGFFIKSNGLIYFFSGLLLFTFLSIRSKGKNIDSVNFFLALLVSQLTLLPLYVQSMFWQTLSSNSRFSLTIGELLRLPSNIWANNLIGAFEIIFWQMTPLVFFGIIVGIAMVLMGKKEERKWPVFWMTANFAMVLIFVRNISPRYMVSFLPLTVVFGGVFFSRLSEKNMFFKLIPFLTTIVAFLGMLVQIFYPLNYFSGLEKITRFSQKNEYVTGWPSGYGIVEALSYIDKKSEKGPVFVGVRVDSGNPENAVITYLRLSDRTNPVYLDRRVFDVDLDTYNCLQSRVPLYFVSRDNQTAGLEKYLQELKRFYKPEGKNYVGVYALKHDCRGKTLRLD